MRNGFLNLFPFDKKKTKWIQIEQKNIKIQGNFFSFEFPAGGFWRESWEIQKMRKLQEMRQLL